jgi:transposase-like protein
MSKDESEIGGGKGRRIQMRAARGSLQAKPKRRSFTAARRQRFLNHFAASCSVRAAARAVGVSESCVDSWRKKCPQFNAGWQEALKLGYANLEADLLRQARKALTIRPLKEVTARVGTMSAETALRVLEAYRRSQGRDLGTIWPHPYEVEDVRRRLEKQMRLLRHRSGGEAEGKASAASE